MLHKHGILNNIWLMEASRAAAYLPMVIAWLKGYPSPFEVKTDSDQSRNDLQLAVKNLSGFELSEYGYDVAPEDAPEESIAIININGAITKYDQDCGPSGMVTKGSLLHRCFACDRIKGIVLNIDSGGGSGDAMRHFVAELGLRNKPVIAFVSDFAASAAYGIASACDIIVANNETAEVGSIGTYISLVDYSEKLKKEGINLIEVYATSSKDKNSEVREALKGNFDPLRQRADHFNNFFLSMVEENRGDKLKVGREEWGTGKLFYADQALEMGLVDSIDSFHNILNYFV